MQTESDTKTTSKKVLLIGSGLIGKRWAVMFARSGYSSVLYDIDSGLISRAVNDLHANIVPSMAADQLLNGHSVEAVNARICGVSSLSEALDGACYVQECVPENLQLKQKVFAQIDLVLDSFGTSTDIIVASSSSNMSMSKISASLKFSSRYIVAHPVNPPTGIPLVEVVPSPQTSADVIIRTNEIMRSIGQTPITINKEVDGFVLNRLQYALLGEAFRLVQDGVCSPEDVDLAVSEGLARRWTFIGPFATIDLNAPGGVRDYCQRYQQAIAGVLRQQDNAVEWSDNTIERVDASMRVFNGPLDALNARMEWREHRLNALQKHLTSQK